MHHRCSSTLVRSIAPCWPASCAEYWCSRRMRPAAVFGSPFRACEWSHFAVVIRSARQVCRCDNMLLGLNPGAVFSCVSRVPTTSSTNAHCSVWRAGHAQFPKGRLMQRSQTNIWPSSSVVCNRAPSAHCRLVARKVLRILGRGWVHHTHAHVHQLGQYHTCTAAFKYDIACIDLDRIAMLHSTLRVPPPAGRLAS